MALKLGYSLTQLEYVLALHKHGHFRQAAEACDVTQPTLSMQIQKLEREMGVVIFDRSKKPILLTEVGRRMIEQIQLIVHEARKVESIIQSSSSLTPHGALTLGVIPTVAPDLLPRLLPELERRYPELRLKILELQTRSIVEALEHDEIDVGLLATPLKLPKIHEYPLYHEPFSVLCRKDHELARLKSTHATKLKAGDIWLLAEGHCLRHQVLDVCSVKSPHPKYQFESGSLETLKNLVDSYGGYTLIPALSQHLLGKSTVLVPFERPIPAREIGLVYRREHYKNDLIEALGEAVLAAIPEEVRKIRRKDLDVLSVQ